jgi:hypothetical protein
MLTGQEQYYLERAGYFIRRNVIPAALQPAVRQEIELNSIVSVSDADLAALATVRDIVAELIPIIRDAIGIEPGHVEVSLLTPGDSIWRRPVFPEIEAMADASSAELARHQKNLFANVALRQDEFARVLPGTHSEPLDEDVAELIRRDPSATVPGEVCIRLNPGDVWFFNGCLGMRSVPVPGVSRLTIQFKAKR